MISIIPILLKSSNVLVELNSISGFSEIIVAATSATNSDDPEVS